MKTIQELIAGHPIMTLENTQHGGTKAASEGSLSESRGPTKVVAAVATCWGLVIRDMQGDELWRGPHDGAPWIPGCNAVVNKHTRRIVHTYKTTTEETVFVATAPNVPAQPRDQ